ncbi:hypothetical protein HDV01_002885 [Terramyces sp. JEL0728]|nr:hypothetical protein HDV01_002885 [Terramyces sp. JEL0728]
MSRYQTKSGFNTGLFYDEDMLQHINPSNTKLDVHYEDGSRISKSFELLANMDLLTFLYRIKIRESASNYLHLTHSADYIRKLREIPFSTPRQLYDLQKNYVDVYLCKNSLQAALVSAAGVYQCCEDVWNGQVNNAFALVRPPGHHATKDEAMGFCLLNNVGLATERMGKGWGGVGDADYLHVFQQIIMPAAYEFNPQLVISNNISKVVCAGFDAGLGDFIGESFVTPAGFAQFTHLLKGLANGKLVLALEGETIKRKGKGSFLGVIDSQSVILDPLASASGNYIVHIGVKSAQNLDMAKFSTRVFEYLQTLELQSMNVSGIIFITVNIPSTILDPIIGNPYKTGKLEQNEIEEDLREILNSEETAEYLNKQLLTVEFEQVSSKGGDDSQRVQPNEDAVDYTDIQEYAEDIAPAPAPLQPAFFKPVQLPVFTAPAPKPVVVHSGRLKFSEIFASHVAPVTRTYRNKVLVSTVDDGFELGKNEFELFQKPMAYRFQKEPEPVVVIEEEEQPVETKPQVEEAFGDASIALSSVMLDHWEEKVVWDADEVQRDHLPAKSIKMFRNEHLEDDSWVEAIFWENDEPYKPIEFHMDDPTLVMLQSEVDIVTKPDPEKSKVSMYKKTPDGKVIDKFNISEDWKYETAKQKLDRIRQTHGPVKLQHSIPAVKLHPHYFKPLLHVKELRSFHRPSIKFTPNPPITFSRVKAMKKKKLKEIDPGEMMRTPKDVSLKDNCKFVLVEYSEEYPPCVQATGMASLIYNYYRKKEEKDNFVPKMANGGAFILEAVDVSPFFGFGDVKPGQTIQVLYNNLSRAPIFIQDVARTDFLAIKHTYQGVTKYFLREIPNIYVAGQSYPVQEVPRPQARKITQALKMRLQVVGYRLMLKDPHRRLQYEKLRRHFPMFSDAQIRQKLKEFAQYLKKGENTGWWKLKNNLILPDEEGIRKMVTPESICLQHSTLVGQQRLHDAGYGLEDFREIEDDDGENESHLDIELQLAPWITTKNFMIAATGKGMVQLFGPGDPTGCGEGFSYIRASMKEMFFHHGETQETRNAFIDKKKESTFHKYSIVEQQKQLENEEEKERQIQFGYDAENLPQPSSPPHIEPEPENEEQGTEADGQSVPGSALASKNKMLIKNETGGRDWKSEVITDGRVIIAYLRHRKLIEAPSTYPAIEGIPQADTDEKARIKRRTDAHIVKLQIKQGKRPPIDDEDLSESELPPEAVQKPLPVVLKIPTLVNSDEKEKKKKRQNTNEFANPPKLVTKRRTSPECDLAEMLEKIVNDLIDIPEAASFLCPVSQFNVPDYYDIVKNPICLEQIRDKVRNFQYQSAQAFFQDVQHVYSNCNLYNGPAHPLTAIAKNMVSKVEVGLQDDVEKYTFLEQEIAKQTLNEKPESSEMVVDKA